ncbi:MAG: hypothetical protein Q8N99_03790 [Nanoarchaeota archaeon]|nr:hypothetical protein [Nanoarchaeota archaeon]
MNNKLFLTLFVMLFLTSNVLAKDVAYVVKTSANPNIEMVLIELGYSYDVIKDSDIPNADFSNYAMLLVQDDVTNKNNLPLATTNLLFLDKNIGTAAWGTRADIWLTSVMNSKFEVLGTPFTTGFTEPDFKAYTASNSVYYLKIKPANVRNIAVSLQSASYGKAIVAYSDENNIRNVFFGFYKIGSWTDETRRLFKNSLSWTRIGVDFDQDGYFSDHDCNDDNADVWGFMRGYEDRDLDTIGRSPLIDVCSGDTLADGYSNIAGDCNDDNQYLYQYIRGYRDIDRDSFGAGNLIDVCSGNSITEGYSLINGDCDDTTALKWHYLKGYQDSDSDSFGAGNLVDVCSGTTLAEGYTNIDGDCDNNNANVNPDSQEIVYDRIDNDCDGSDLADSDSDGYCKLGYVIMDKTNQCNKETGITGSDCNDNDISVNPEMDNSYVNCRNDPPILTSLNLIVVKEEEDVIVTVNAIDPEGDSVTYSIDDPRFIQNPISNNVFTWRTEYEDYGEYIFNIIASDGRLESMIDFEVSVENTNRAPICEIVPDIAVEEDETYDLDLSEFCTDPDSDELGFDFSSLSQSHLIIEMDNNIATIKGEQDWSGGEWIDFIASDGDKEVRTNRVIVQVGAVNDPPEFDMNIDDISWNQDINLTNRLNLADYFHDVDNSIIYTVSGNDLINVIIRSGKVSFNVLKDWVGSETVIFTASDGENTVDSNEVNMNVLYVDKPPVFEENACEKNILEENDYTCEIIANDPESEEITLSVLSEDDLECSFDSNILNYVSKKDIVGSASCIIRASDIYNNTRDMRFDAIVENVNDAPIIKDNIPKLNFLKLLSNVSHRFIILAEDIDSDELSYEWQVNGVMEGNSTSFYLEKSRGAYNVTASVFDGEFRDSYSWNVFIGNVIDFKCSELNGYICTEEQVCSQDFYGVYDSPRCCPTACRKRPPQFSGVKTTTANKTDNIRITFISPTNLDKYNLGEKIPARIEIGNLMESSLDMKIESYLYDITKERAVLKSEEKIKLDKSRIMTIDQEFISDYELNEGHEYAIFTRAIGEDKDNQKYYNQNYIELDLERRDHHIIIKNIEIIPENDILCGDNIDVRLELFNLGSNDENTYLKIENPILKINERYEEIKIERYDDEDTINEQYILKIPEGTKPGNYTLRFSLSFWNETIYSEESVSVARCEEVKSEVTSLETIKLTNQESLSVMPVEDNSNKIAIFLLLNGMTIILLTTAVILAFIYKKKNAKIVKKKKLGNNNFLYF